MNKILGLYALFFCFLSCQRADVQPTQNCHYEDNPIHEAHPKAEQYHAILDKYRRLGLPGIVALIEDENGEWVGYAGKADIAENIDFSPCQPSKAASITKLMVATLCYMLEEEGQWSLDDPLSQYIDASILDKVENASQATIRHCLKHSTGIYDIIDDAGFYLAVLNNPNREWTATDLIRYAYGKESLFAFDSHVKYCNTNTLLVSMALDKLLGRSHAQVLREKLWNPLDMRDTYYQSREKLPDYVAQGYYDLYNDGTIVNVSNLITGSGNGYGGVFSTVFDLQKFMKALYYDKSLISSSSLDSMMVFREENELRDIGGGILRMFKHFGNHPGIGHSGRDLGYSADLFAFPSSADQLMILFVNYGTNGDTHLREVFWDFEEELIFAITE